jgi:CHASE2 domain-containing sensor protein
MGHWRSFLPNSNGHQSTKQAAWRFYREITVASCAALALFFTLLAKPPITIDGPIFDYTILARFLISPELKDPSKVVVVGFDAKTLASKSLSAYPFALQMPFLARIVDMAFNAGADAVGFDILFEYDPGRLPGVEADLGKAFVDEVAKHREKIVLGRSRDTLPNARLVAAAGPNALATLYTPADPDGRYR